MKLRRAAMVSGWVFLLVVGFVGCSGEQGDSDTNTAGFVLPVASYVRDFDNDRQKDILMSFDRGELMALRSISTPEDGDPVMALGVGEERFMILEMYNIQDTNLDLDNYLSSPETITFDNEKTTPMNLFLFYQHLAMDFDTLYTLKFEPG